MDETSDKSYRTGTLILKEIKFDRFFKRTVMRSGKVGKVYLPKELIGKQVCVVVEIDGSCVEDDKKC